MRRILLCSLPLALALTACAGDGGETPEADAQAEEAVGEGAAELDETEVAERAQVVAEGFVASVAAGDGEAACAMADDSAQAAIAAQSEGAEDCADAFPDYVANLPGAEDFEVGEVTVSTDLDGETQIANVELVHPDEPSALEVREGSDGEWRATRVPGTTLGGA